MNSEEGVEPIVVDYGSGLMKAGFAGNDAPSVVFSTVVGYPKSDLVMAGIKKEEYIGDKAISFRGILKLSQPIKKGVVVNWEEMEKIWHHTFYNELKISPSKQPLIVSEPVLNPKENRERLTRLMFETFQVPGLYIACGAVLSVYSAARTSAMVIESGDGVTYTTPVWEGYCVLHSIHRVNLGGEDISAYLAEVLKERGYSFTASSEMDMIRNIKEKLCFTSLNYEEELLKYDETMEHDQFWELPDGNIITLGNEMFRATEIMFKPYLVGKECLSITEAVFRTIQNCDTDIRADNYQNIVLSGGNTMFRNFGERLEQELRELVPPTISPKVVAVPERKYISWIGGSILASLSSFQQMWYMIDEYEDEGPEGIHERAMI